MPLPDSIFRQIKQLIPPLNGTLHKGQSGRIGVLGGALDYTGAPFFAAFSAMRIGVDLSHVICAPTAAGAIKGYAPDLIVHPILHDNVPQESVESELKSLFLRLHVLVLGPGLGREKYMLTHARTAVRLARERGLFLVLDADALFLLSQAPDLVRGYPRSVLTPNVVEFKRLCEAIDIDPNANPSQQALLASRALGGVTILQKGPTDIIAVHPCPSSPFNASLYETTPDSGRSVEVSDAVTSAQDAHATADVPHKIEVNVPGSLKRCGGQGDILSGTVGAFLAWGRCLEEGAWTPSPISSPAPADLQSPGASGKSASTSMSTSPRVPSVRIPLIAAAGAALVTRTAAHRGFLKHGRALITQDMLGELGGAFAETFGADAEWGEYASYTEGAVGKERKIGRL